MKRSSLRASKSLIIVLVALVVGALASCGKPGDRFSSETYRIPWPDSGGDIHLQNIEIRTLTKPEHFEGSTAKILVEPSDGGGQLSGEAPVGRFVRTSEGPIIPADYLTLQAITAYAHQERLHDLDEKAGAASLLSWPLSIGVEVRVLGAKGAVKNNAIYDAKLNSLLLVPYTQGDLPIALSPGILGHEHFHFIFQKMVMSRVADQGSQTSCAGAVPSSGAPAPVSPSESKPRPTALFEAMNSNPCNRLDDAAQTETCEKTALGLPKKIFNLFLLRAMNEGFADFWGWLYSKDDFFISKSLPSETTARRLDIGGGRLMNEKLMRENLVDLNHPDKILDDDGRAHDAYVLGSQYARFLRQSVHDLVNGKGLTEDEAKFAIAKALIKALPSIADVVAANFETKYLSPNVLLKPLILNLPAVSEQFCQRLDGFYAPETAYEKPRACSDLEQVAPTPSPVPDLTVKPIAPVKPKVTP